LKNEAVSHRKEGKTLSSSIFKAPSEMKLSRAQITTKGASIFSLCAGKKYISFSFST
jgi:hypothetical protein